MVQKTYLSYYNFFTCIYKKDSQIKLDIYYILVIIQYQTNAIEVKHILKDRSTTNALK